MSLIEEVRRSNIPSVIDTVAVAERISPETLAQDVEAGRSVIVRSELRSGLAPLGIGRGLRTKINANIGTSEVRSDIDDELAKLAAAISAGADAVMDLSTGGDVDSIRKKIIQISTVPIGTVPIYQAAIGAKGNYGSVLKMTKEDMFDAVIKHAEDGVDFITVHTGINRDTVNTLQKAGRIMDAVSRGGAFLVAWILENDQENPFFEHFDRLIEISKKYEMVLSLGDGMRPGCLHDASDSAQFAELMVLGDQSRIANEAGVQSIIEGPGHVPINEIEMNVKLQKSLCRGAPFYILGPLVTDIAPGYDHITAAIGGAIAGMHGADFLCYVTPREHLGLPDIQDVKDGVIASKIAAHVADVAKGVPGAISWDNKMAAARKSLDWELQKSLSIDPEKANEMHTSAGTQESECSMCGEFCSMKLMNECFDKDLLNSGIDSKTS